MMSAVKRDAHGRAVTAVRQQFQSEIARRALHAGIPGYRVGAYKPDRYTTTALLRERPHKPAPVADWHRHRFRSTVLERGIYKALNDLDDFDFPGIEVRTRIAQASWSGNAGYLAIDDCRTLVLASLYAKKGES